MQLFPSIISRLSSKPKQVSPAQAVFYNELPLEQQEASCYETINYLIARGVLYACGLDLESSLERYLVANLGPNIGMGELKVGELERILDLTVGTSPTDEGTFLNNLYLGLAFSKKFEDLPFYRKLMKNTDKEKQIRQECQLDGLSLCVIGGIYLLRQAEKQKLLTWSEIDGVIHRNRLPYQMQLSLNLG